MRNEVLSYQTLLHENVSHLLGKWQSQQKYPFIQEPNLLFTVDAGSSLATALQLDFQSTDAARRKRLPTQSPSRQTCASESSSVSSEVLKRQLKATCGGSAST